MTRDTGRRQRGAAAAAGGHVRRHAHRPTVEPLEGRSLLSTFYPGLTAIDPVQTAGGTYTLTINGPGVERVRHAGHGEISVTLLGTTAATTLNIAMTRAPFHAAVKTLQIASIKVNTGQLGGIIAPGVDLNGAITPLSGSVNTLQFADLGPSAEIDIPGSLASLSVSGNLDLGAGGHVNIGTITQGLTTGALNVASGGKFSVGSLTAPADLGAVDVGPGGVVNLGSATQGLTTTALDIAGGRFSIGGDLAGPLNLSSVALTDGGQFVVAHDVTGLITVSGDASVTGTGSLFSIGHDLVGGFAVGGDLTLDSNGQFAVGNDLTGPVNVGGVLSISNNARFIVNRDVTGTITVAGDLDLASGGTLAVGRTLNALAVNGDLSVAPTGGGITVGGNLGSLTVNGAFSGQGSATNPDLNVGLNLGALNVLGGGAGQGGLQGVYINVEKSIVTLNIAHGIFNSLITAGVSISGGAPGTTGNNVGADGTDAVLNSQILAGVSITDLTIGGDVRSTFATNPASTGYPTRIVAGEYPQGTYASGGLIDNFQITGALIDSVLAASVVPYGGDGTLPTMAYGTPPPVVGSPSSGEPTIYDAPAGTITGGTVGNPIKYPNYSELSYYNETLTGVTWDTALTPTINDTILPGGAINPSFASPPLSQTALTTSETITSSTQGTQTTTSSASTSQSNSGSTTTEVVTPSAQSLPLPTKSTVLGGVISTVHGDNADFAGIFAADTSGVFVGPLPSSSS